MKIDKKAPEPITAVQVKKTIPDNQVAYVGPEIRQPVHITRYQVFRNGLPKELAAYLTKKPELKQFLVPVKELASAMADLKNPESLLARKFVEVKGGR